MGEMLRRITSRSDKLTSSDSFGPKHAYRFVFVEADP
jgi:hypothetical protein